jgi:hypothetical protein
VKVVGEAPTGRSRRLIATEHGIPYRVRASGERSAHTSRRSNDLPGRTRRSSTGQRAIGEPLEPDAATRNAERPKGEKRQLASRMLGKLARPVLRRADGKGPRERHLVSRLSYLGHPFRKRFIMQGEDRHCVKKGEGTVSKFIIFQNTYPK